MCAANVLSVVLQQRKVVSRERLNKEISPPKTALEHRLLRVLFSKISSRRQLRCIFQTTHAAVPPAASSSRIPNS